MEHTELQRIQESTRFKTREIAECLGLDYEQYRRYYYGHSKIPDEVERAALELEQIDKKFFARYLPGGEFDQELTKKYPCGIPSEI